MAGALASPGALPGTGEVGGRGGGTGGGSLVPRVVVGDGAAGEEKSEGEDEWMDDG